MWKVHVYQEVVVELKVRGELEEQLVNAVQPLEEDGAALVDVGACRVLPAAIAEPVTKPQPLSLHQHLEPLHTVQHDAMPRPYHQQHRLHTVISVTKYCNDCNTF